jgi:hypothetical protein
MQPIFQYGGIKTRTPVTYLRCNSVTNINMQRNTKSYNAVLALERNHNLFIYAGKTPYNSYNKHLFYSSLMIYNLSNNSSIRLSVLSCHIFLHLKGRNTWNIGYLLFAFQTFRRSPDYNVYSFSIDRICHNVF